MTMKISEFKKMYKFSKMKTEDDWKVNFVEEIVNLKLQLEFVPDQLTIEEIDEIVNFIVIN